VRAESVAGEGTTFRFTLAPTPVNPTRAS